jgi:hypothetical protein
MLATAPLLVALLLPIGPVVSPRNGPPPTASGGVVFVVDGVGGFQLFCASVRWSLPRAGVHHEVREFNWSHGFGQLLKDLQDTRHLLRKAEELAAEIRRVKAERPDDPVFVVAKSGGTGPALAAVEQLPPATLERLVLVSSALSPGYDLRQALRATRREVVSFSSPVDQLVLGLGTRQFGTIDRVYGPSAGLHGFQVPPNLPPEERALYDRLVQVRWRAGMILQGNHGGHAGTSTPAFVAREIAPWLRP